MARETLGQVALKLRPEEVQGLEAWEFHLRWGSTCPVQAAEGSWRVSDG